MTHIAAGDLAQWRGALALLWREAFGDGPGFTGAFLGFAARQGALRALVVDGVVASMAAALPVGIALEDGQVLPACYLYGLCTAARLRGQGHARRLVESICAEAGADGCAAVVTQPASPSLAGWYGSQDFDCGAIPPSPPADDSPIKPYFAPLCEGGGVKRRGESRLAAAEYQSLREDALRGRRHVDYGEAFLKFAEWDCSRDGGGFFRLPDGTLEAIGTLDGAMAVLERLRPGAEPEGASMQVAPMARWLRDARTGAAGGGAGWMPFTLG